MAHNLILPPLRNLAPLTFFSTVIHDRFVEEKSGAGQVLSPGVQALPYQCYSTITPYSFIYLLPTPVSNKL
jgi:hypothetical protein